MRIAIIGFGFSGLMTAANLVRGAHGPLELYLIDPEQTGLGAAYGTVNPAHLLNVRAENMGAWADDAGDFAAWLARDEGKYAAAARKVPLPGPKDFAPRALYGDYLAAILQRTKEEASAKGLSLKLVPARAVHIAATGETFAVTTDRGDAIACDRVVLASGHETQAALPQLDARFVVQNPWRKDAITPHTKSQGPVVLLGTGLTAVDMIISLRRAAYGGPIVALSRRGLFPQPHRDGLQPFALDATALFAQPSLLALLHFVRRTVRDHEAAGGDWREVVDALRPHTQRLWSKLSAAEQKRFLARLLPYWNVHRHRMAPQIAAQLKAEIEGGHLRVMSYRRLQATMEEGQATLEVTTQKGAQKTLAPDGIISCIGPELRLQRSSQNLPKQLLADGLAEPPPNGVGFAADPYGRLFGATYPRLYAVGSLLTGQFLESTAVPELRVQAQNVAKQLLAESREG